MNSIEAVKTEVFFTLLMNNHQKQALLKCWSRLYLRYSLNKLKFVEEC